MLIFARNFVNSGREIQSGELMVKSRLRDWTEPAVFVPEVAKQHHVFAGAISFGVLVSARASF